MAERAGLENRSPGNWTASSNLAPSAILQLRITWPIPFNCSTVTVFPECIDLAVQKPAAMTKVAEGLPIAMASRIFYPVVLWPLHDLQEVAA